MLRLNADACVQKRLLREPYNLWGQTPVKELKIAHEAGRER
jgi:hypothetical protein